MQPIATTKGNTHLLPNAYAERAVLVHAVHHPQLAVEIETEAGGLKEGDRDERSWTSQPATDDRVRPRDKKGCSWCG
jgi:hypothetical protein